MAPPWLALDSIQIGFVIGVGMISALAILGLMPTARPERLQGLVTQVGPGIGRSVTTPRAFVSVAGRLSAVALDYSDRCAAGDRIRLVREHRIWGSFLRADVYACVPRTGDSPSPK